MPAKGVWRPFTDAREFARGLGFKSGAEWRAYSKSGAKPEDIPSDPRGTYRSEFRGWGDWLGTGTVWVGDREFRPFEEARAFVRSLGLKNYGEWQAYSKSEARPRDIPSSPGKTYRSEFQGMGDWLGTGNIAPSDREFRPFVEARAFVHSLGLKNHTEWMAYSRSGERPADIPSTPRKAYPSAFQGIGDWLGTGNVAPSAREFRPFDEARAFVHSLGLKSGAEWRAYARSGAKPEDIPSNPSTAYRSEFQGIGDWLGTGNVAPSAREFRPFDEARAFVHNLQLKSYGEWIAYRQSEARPRDIPSDPSKTYHSEFRGYGDWLGTGRVSNQHREFRPFAEARAFTHSLELKSYEEWRAYTKSGAKPEDIPANPRGTYASEFRGYGDWLGTGSIAPQNREHRPFMEARAFVRSLGLKSGAEWRNYCRSGAKPEDIPANPRGTYASEFRGIGDWLEAGNVAGKHRKFRPFADAREFARGLGLKSGSEWSTFCRSGARPQDIPANPGRTYPSEFQGMGDWLGTANVAPSAREFRPFAKARAFVHGLGLKSQTEWRAYSKSGAKPEDIPSNPSTAYRSEFRSYGDWLGTGTVWSGRRMFRPFAGARAFVHGLGLKSQAEWMAYCRSGARPQDIPSDPRAVYSSEFVGYGDWLGTGNVAPSAREFRPFAEARAFVHGLGLMNGAEWRAYSKSGAKPDDIPGDPRDTYPSEFRGMGDWLGTGSIAPQNREYRAFVEARAFVHGLELKTVEEWNAYRRSGAKPADIPSSPAHTYPLEYRGMGDWLGRINQWKRSALLALLEDLRPRLPQLEERELYVILQQGGAMPALRAALEGASPMRVLRDLKNGGDSVEQALRAQQDTGSDADDRFSPDAPVLLDAHIEVPDQAIPGQGELFSHAAATESDAGSEIGRNGGATLPTLVTPEGLRVVDALAGLAGGLDDEAAEYLVANRVSALWERYINEADGIVDEVLAGEGGRWFEEIRGRFLAERAAVEALPLPPGYAFAVDGRPALPNRMQLRAAWAVREQRRVGNWSGVGAGKTLSAVLASRVADARVTLVVTNNATVKGWKDQIVAAFPDSIVHTRVHDGLVLDRERHNYLVLNYERFQTAGRDQLLHRLLGFGLDFVVLDEVQFVKQRDANASKRRKALEALVSAAAEQNPELRVLGMSATPVINNLLEARKLLEIVTGTGFPELDTHATVNNALLMHRMLMLHGFRYRPRYEQEMHTEVVGTTCNELLEPLREVGSDVLSVEQLLLPAKLERVRPFVRRGSILYTHYVEGMVAPIREYVEAIGLRVGLYTGTDKSGLDDFLAGRVDVLIGSSPVGTGLDGLQRVCDRLIMLSLPWTGAEYEQIIGRIRRQGGAFDKVDIIIPQVVLDHEGDTWSWDQGRLATIRYKQTLSDCAVNGDIPETVRISPTALLQQSREALERWIERVGEQGLLTFARERLVVPLPPDMRHAAVLRHGDFTVLNRRWNTSRSATTHQRLQEDPSEWYLYHTLYREARDGWPEQPYERIAEQVRLRPDWVVGDFGCGEALLAGVLPNHVIGLDHVALNESVTACDLSSTPLEDASLDVAVFSLSLMGTNWQDYLQEAHRTLKPYGHLFIAEPEGRWHDRIGDLKNAVEAAGFHVTGEAEQRYSFVYLMALKASLLT